MTVVLTSHAGRSIFVNMSRLYNSFAEFWPFYLREHSKTSTRALHYVGTSLVVLIAVAAVLSGRWGWLVALPVAGYFFAWVAHFGVEKNSTARGCRGKIDQTERKLPLALVANRS